MLNFVQVFLDNVISNRFYFEHFSGEYFMFFVKQNDI